MFSRKKIKILCDVTCALVFGIGLYVSEQNISVTSSAVILNYPLTSPLPSGYAIRQACKSGVLWASCGRFELFRGQRNFSPQTVDVIHRLHYINSNFRVYVY
jgi:hypothetical protein